MKYNISYTVILVIIIICLILIYNYNQIDKNIKSFNNTLVFCPKEYIHITIIQMT